MVNWQLMKHPVNWIIVILMLAIAGAAGIWCWRILAQSRRMRDCGKRRPARWTV